MNADQKANLKNVAIAALSFTFLFGIIETFIAGIAYAVIAAPIAGLVFGLLMYLFLNSKKVKEQTTLAKNDQERIIYSGAANHFKNAEAVGGKLYLLNDRLEFKSHGFNIQNHAFNIYLTEIKELNFYKTLGIVPNGLEIILSNGEVEKFVVNNRSSWKTEIEKSIKVL
ncbi:hypothetical protein EV200_101331 [Pedobacter psychrotolerans]|uniref:GRAM domain-containing protein n=1 Tax=Pedobacter psychrotolerans TaxID=1843235 RepID=A0A4R2HMM3_9SPHI|nr:hypothetical protein [Pedobacter psychrotolerans]TCO30892.1 hypothetical protein EV200_101331 [Pedobacter psychrotolerans]GGE43720.1 hypothetical protein GCM10011413_07180 [Pedobacter psychrotolerans]